MGEKKKKKIKITLCTNTNWLMFKHAIMMLSRFKHRRITCVTKEKPKIFSAKFSSYATAHTAATYSPANADREEVK